MIEKIAEWINYIQTPRQELGGFAVCPYAKLAVANNSYAIHDTTIATVKKALEAVDTNKHLVTILILRDYLNYDVDYLLSVTKTLNGEYNSNDLVILENDPRTPMIVNGVVTTFDGSFLWLIQSLSDLNKKSKDLEKTSYYSYWTKKQLEEVVTWRT